MFQPCITQVRKVPLLRELMQHDSDFEKVAAQLTVVDFEVDEAIVEQGDAADALYMLQARVCVTSSV